jgi:hypothetical protein
VTEARNGEQELFVIGNSIDMGNGFSLYRTLVQQETYDKAQDNLALIRWEEISLDNNLVNW